MERLTRKITGRYWSDYSANECVDKLGHAEDIEEKHNMSIDEMDAYITEHKKNEQRCEIIDTKIEKYEEGEMNLFDM